MNTPPNFAIYRFYAPVYDKVFGWVFAGARRRAIRMLELERDARVLLPGVGTGLDLDLLPDEIKVTAIDLSPEMLAQARIKLHRRAINWALMNAQTLGLPSESFDAVVLSLILSVAPDGAQVFREAWRVLRRNGTLIIFDKFLPETSKLSPMRRWVGALISAMGTDPNRRLTDLIGGVSDLIVERNEPGLLGGQYRILVLRKSGIERGNPR